MTELSSQQIALSIKDRAKAIYKQNRRNQQRCYFIRPGRFGHDVAYSRKVVCLPNMVARCVLYVDRHGNVYMGKSGMYPVLMMTIPGTNMSDINRKMAIRYAEDNNHHRINLMNENSEELQRLHDRIASLAM